MLGGAPSLGVAERIKELEIQGYTLLPGLLDPEQVERLPVDVRPYLCRPNRGLSDTTTVNWREDLPPGGSGLRPRRWSRHAQMTRESGETLDGRHADDIR